MVKARFDPAFQKQFSKLKDSLTKERIVKQIDRIRCDPEIGKPMSGSRRGTRELRVLPFRLSYVYHVDIQVVEILDFYHKDKQ